MDKVVVRFYLMMFGTLILGFAGSITLAAIWGGLLALSSILGISIHLKKPKIKLMNMGNVKRLAASQKFQELG